MTDVIETLLREAEVQYVFSLAAIRGDCKIPTMEKLRKGALSGNLGALIIDFTDSRGSEFEERVKRHVRSKMAVFMDCDLMIITKYRKGIMLTPVANKKNPALAKLVNAASTKLMKNAVKAPPLLTRVKGSSNDEQDVPNIAFYLNIQYNIPSSACTSHNSTMWGQFGSRNFCSNPHMSLIFQVNLERSLTFGTGGSATPDAKIVRICSDENSGGAGVHLNDSLTHKEYYAPYVTLDAYFREWSSSAIALSYSVDISCSNNKASVLKTCPENNLNKNYDKTETSGFSLGVSGGVEADKGGPKATLSASASYTQTKTLHFQTNDYCLERNTEGPQNISFRWIREQYKYASSLLNRSTDALWVDTFPADLGRVQAMGYQSFVPKFDVVYKASPTATGVTQFVVNPAVQIMPLYHAAYKHYYVVGGHQSYHGTGYDNKETKTASTTITFDVDWEHAVFTGGRPVNLQSKAYANICVAIEDNGVVKLATGDLKSAKQSYIYDKVGRYVSAYNTNICLDASDLTQFQPVSASLTQRWTWKEDSDYLFNEYHSDKCLAVDETGSKLILADESDSSKTKFLTAFTDLFTTKSG